MSFNIVFSQPNSAKNGTNKSSSKESRLTNKDWGTTTISYNDSNKIIVIYSVGMRKKNKHLTRVINIKVEQIPDNCKLIINSIKYYSSKNNSSIVARTSKVNDNINIFQLLKYSENNSPEEGEIAGPTKTIKVDCETLSAYLKSLPTGSAAVIKPNFGDNISNGDKFKRFVLIPNFTLGATYSTVSVDTGYFGDPQALTKRIESQKRLTGYNYGIAIGFRPTQKHIIYFEGSYGMMGFETRYYTIDWQTGFLSDPNSQSTKYIFKNFTVGIGYILAPPPKGSIGYIVQLGTYYSINSGKTYQAKGFENSTDSKYIKSNRFGGKTGLGLSFKFSDCLSLNLLAAYQWDFNSVNEGELSTRLKLLGLNMGLMCSL